MWNGAHDSACRHEPRASFPNRGSPRDVARPPLYARPASRTPCPASSNLTLDSRGSAPTPSHAAVMYHAVIWQYCHDAVAQPLVTDTANPLLADHYPPVPASGPVTLTQQEFCLSIHEQSPSQALDHAALGQPGIGRANSPGEVRFQLIDGQVIRDKRQGRGGRQARPMFGKQSESRLQVGLVWRRGCEVETEESVINGWRRFWIFLVLVGYYISAMGRGRT